jgi:hypothetical protein
VLRVKAVTKERRAKMALLVLKALLVPKALPALKEKLVLKEI